MSRQATRQAVDLMSKENRRELSRLEKRYKRLRWTQTILGWLSVIVAIAPVTWVTFKVGVEYKEAEQSWSLAGFAIIIIAIGVILMTSGLIFKYREKLPWALLATVGSWIMTALLWSLQKIIGDALYISLALAIGCSAALILGSISDLCKVQADGIEQEYHRRQD